MTARFENQGRGRGRIGAIVPANNRNLEPDFMLLSPPGVSTHFSRVGGNDYHGVPTYDEMQRYVSEPLEPPVMSLVAGQIGVIAYGCTSATLSGGAKADRELREQIERLSGLPAVSAASSLLEGLSALGVSRVAFTSPYVRELHCRAVAFLESCGVEVVSEADVGRDLGPYEQQLDPRSVYELGCRADDDRAEALVLSCTEMRSVEALVALENDLDKPVVASNQALMYASLNRIGIDPSGVEAGGRLFSLGFSDVAAPQAAQ